MKKDEAPDRLYGPTICFTLRPRFGILKQNEGDIQDWKDEGIEETYMGDFKEQYELYFALHIT